MHSLHMLNTSNATSLRLVTTRYNTGVSRKHHLSSTFWLALALRMWSVAQDFQGQQRQKLLDRSNDCRARARYLEARKAAS